jgi:hypothetical protein
MIMQKMQGLPTFLSKRDGRVFCKVVHKPTFEEVNDATEEYREKNVSRPIGINSRVSPRVRLSATDEPEKEVVSAWKEISPACFLEVHGQTADTDMAGAPNIQSHGSVRFSACAATPDGFRLIASYVNSNMRAYSLIMTSATCRYQGDKQSF